MTRSAWSWRWAAVPMLVAMACLGGCGGSGSSGDASAPPAPTEQKAATGAPPPAAGGSDAAEARRERRREERERRQHGTSDGARPTERQSDQRGTRGDRGERDASFGGPQGERPGLDPRRAERGDRRVQAAFAAGPMDVAAAQSGRVHGRLVEFDATVVRLLRDDRRGLQHQRFLVSTAQTGTLLIAHNTDLAAAVPVAVGDRVHVRGLFEWNPKGGVVHWTHHDPSGKTAGGFIRLRDRTYQ